MLDGEAIRVENPIMASDENPSLLSSTSWDNVRIGLHQLNVSEEHASNFKRSLRRSSLLSLNAKVTKHEGIPTAQLTEYARDMEEEYNVKDGEVKLADLLQSEAGHVVIEQFDKEHIEMGYQLYVIGATSDKSLYSAVLVKWNEGVVKDIHHLSNSHSLSISINSRSADATGAAIEDEDCCLIIGFKKLGNVILALIKCWFWGLSDDKENEVVTPRGSENDERARRRRSRSPSDPDDALNYFRQQALQALECEGLY